MIKMVNSSSLPFKVKCCPLRSGMWIDEDSDLALHSTDKLKVNFFQRAFCVLCILKCLTFALLVHILSI